MKSEAVKTLERAARDVRLGCHFDFHLALAAVFQAAAEDLSMYGLPWPVWSPRNKAILRMAEAWLEER